jgi:hypothetical protein
MRLQVILNYSANISLPKGGRCYHPVKLFVKGKGGCFIFFAVRAVLKTAPKSPLSRIVLGI